MILSPRALMASDAGAEAAGLDEGGPAVAKRGAKRRKTERQDIPKYVVSDLIADFTTIGADKLRIDETHDHGQVLSPVPCHPPA